VSVLGAGVPGDPVADELAALRRVAALVARGGSPEEVFAAVAAEAGLLLGAGLTTVARYDPGGVVTILGAWSSAGAADPRSVHIPLIGPPGRG
jgi:GAF domain-containing protein